ncbi:MAG: SDR family oxidoreductase, partial [Pseudomonadota bacterium]
MFDLTGCKALVVGVANDQSIAYGCAKAFRAQGADLAITYLNEKAEPFVRPLAEELGADIIAPLDVRNEGELDALFAMITEKWGKLDTLLHSIAFSKKDDLHGRVVDCSADGFSLAMDISVHSFLRLIRKAEPLMPKGGTCMTVSFMGAQKVVENYG